MKSRGQVMALGAVTMLVLALMLMFSFSLTRAVHEKIRLQSHSDAMAYSMATVGARAMNFYAYSNRATAAAAVSIMTLHAYHSSMALTGAAFRTAMWIFIGIVGWHVGLFLAGCLPCNWAELANAIQAGRVVAAFGREATRYERALRGHEGRFNNAVRAYSMMIDMVWASQQSVTLHTANVMRGNGLDSLQALNAPCASQLAPAVGLMNVREFACALEGSPIDFTCVGGRARSPLLARSRTIANVANAARGDFPKDRVPFPTLFHPRALMDLMRSIQGRGFTVPFIVGGSSKATQGRTVANCQSGRNNLPGETICGVDSAMISSFFINNPPIPIPFSSGVYSDNAGGGHTPGAGHQGQHREWRGFARTDAIPACLTAGECFTNFRSDPRPGQDFGQPKIFGHFSQSLRDTTNCQRGPWEFGTDGKLTVGDGARGEGVLDFLPTEPATAVSKAMVYFHRPDNWQMPPNAFDPYWKAKLHPMTNQEAATVLTLAGDLTGAGMAMGGPVEGRDRF